MKHSRESELVDIDAELRGETDLAFRLFDGTNTRWLPKRFIERNPNGSWTLPLWLAKDKGLV